MIVHFGRQYSFHWLEVVVFVFLVQMIRSFRRIESLVDNPMVPSIVTAPSGTAKSVDFGIVTRQEIS